MSLLYDSTNDWKRFLGNYRTGDGAIYCGYQNAAEALGLTNIVYNYRFGNDQSLVSDIGIATATALEPDGATVVLTEHGVRATGHAGLLLGGSTLDHTLINSDPGYNNNQIIDGSVISFWTIPDTATAWDYAHLMGWTYDRYGDHVDYTDEQNASWSYQVGSHIKFSLYFNRNWLDVLEIHIAMERSETDANYSSTLNIGNFDSYLEIPDDLDDGGEHHFALHMFTYRENGDQKYKVRIMMDGKYLGEMAPAFTGHDVFTFGTFPSPHNAVLLGHGQATVSGPGLCSTWVPLTMSTDGTPPAHEIDEYAMAHCHLGGNLSLTPPWVQGEQVVPAITRHPNLAELGVSDPAFEYLGPVEDLGVGVNSALNRVQAQLQLVPGLTPAGYAGTIEIAGRASVTTFAQDASDVDWGEWTPLKHNVMQNLPTVTTGRYAQVKLRIFPETSNRCMQSPGITSLAIYGPVGSPIFGGSANLPCRLKVGSYSDLPAKIRVHGIANCDLPARVFIYTLATPVDLPARIFLQAGVSLPARIFAKAGADLPARLLLIKEMGYANLPASIIVQRNEFDLPAKIFVKCAADLPARVNLTQFVLPCRILVGRPVSRNLGCRLFMLAETPGSPQNLTGTVPAQAWQTTATATFSWDAPVPKTIPVTQYRYSFSKTHSNTPSGSWTATANRSVTLSMSSSGIWYFSVVSQNADGRYSNVVTYEVWYNHAPTTPGTSLTINGVNTLTGQPLIACHPNPYHVLAWTAATDSDVNDNSALTYEIQVATQSDFGTNLQTGLSSVVKSYQNLPGTTFHWSDLPQYGIYFWRIRASDSKQSSGWSGTGSFRINAAPERPTGLIVRQR